MVELVDIRLNEDWAEKYLDYTWGNAIPLPHGAPPLVRQIVLQTSDPRFAILKEKLFEYPSGLLSAADSRVYDVEELAAAFLLHLIITEYIDICGEDYGTVYDDSNSCPRCGLGRQQISPLRLDLTRIPKGVNLVTTIARGEEVLLSQSLADRIKDNGILGCKLIPVQHVGRKTPYSQWYQFMITATAGETVAPTRFAKDFLRDDTAMEFSCAGHGLSGLNLVSEVYVKRSSLPTADIMKTKNRYGMQSGCLMPSVILLITQKFRGLLSQAGMGGYRLEVAHIVDG